MMLLLFVAGTMNLVWIALIAAFVLMEKLLPLGNVLSYSAGDGVGRLDDVFCRPCFA